MSVVAKLWVVLQRHSCAMCASQTSTSPAHNGRQENWVHLLFCKKKIKGSSTPKPVAVMVPKGHCSGKAACSLLGRGMLCRPEWPASPRTAPRCRLCYLQCPACCRLCPFQRPSLAQTHHCPASPLNYLSLQWPARQQRRPSEEQQSPVALQTRAEKQRCLLQRPPAPSEGRAPLRWPQY